MPRTLVWATAIISGVPFGTHIAWLSIRITGAPFDICPNYRAALPAGTTGACTQDVTLSFNQFRDSRTTPYQTGTNSKVGLNVSGGSEALTVGLGRYERDTFLDQYYRLLGPLEHFTRAEPAAV